MVFFFYEMNANSQQLDRKKNTKSSKEMRNNIINYLTLYERVHYTIINDL